MMQAQGWELEICCYTAACCAAAAQGGATRAELCMSPAEGGLSPSPGTVELARELAPGLPLHLMVRPRGGDFCYSPAEIRTLKADIRRAQDLGAAGLVFGILTPAGAVDADACASLLALAGGLPCTFHRAFDRTHDAAAALDDLIHLGFHRVLTSGRAYDVTAGQPTLAALQQQAAGRIQIMAGGGVRTAQAVPLLEAGIRHLHSSASTRIPSRMTYRNPAFQAQPGDSDAPAYPAVDTALVRALVQAGNAWFDSKNSVNK